MKTYAETQGKKPFDWNAFLEKESYTEDELYQAIDSAIDWVTCACGNQCDVIPRGYDGKPLDRRLKKLGREFFVCIKTMYYYFKADEEQFENCRHLAISTLHAIEARSQEIINQIKK